MAETSTFLIADALEARDPRDPRFEAKFKEWNLPYRFEAELPIEGIRVADWAQVRSVDSLSGTAFSESLEEFRQMLANGAVFPPITVMAPDILIDGNNRLGAYKKLRRKAIPAYLVDLASVQIAKSLAAALNQLNGRRLTSDEALEAVKVMMSMQFADEAIAREIGRSVEQVRNLRNQVEFADRADKLKLTTMAAPIKNDMRQRINSISHNPPFAAMVEFVGRAHPPAKIVRETISKVHAAPSDSDAIQVIKNMEAEIRPAGPPPQPRPTLSEGVRQSGMAIANLVKLADNPEDLYDPREDQRELRIDQWQKVNRLSNRMLELYGVLVPA